MDSYGKSRAASSLLWPLTKIAALEENMTEVEEKCTSVAEAVNDIKSDLPFQAKKGTKNSSYSLI